MAPAPNPVQAPFTVCLLKPDRTDGSSAATDDDRGGASGRESKFWSYMPATYQPIYSSPAVPQYPYFEFLKHDLLLPTYDLLRKTDILTDVMGASLDHLRTAPIHLHVALGREVTVLETMITHMAFVENRIFLKPVPSYLLDPDFWAECLTEQTELRACALGFLHSYTRLIRRESDFRIAKEKGLLPSSVNWMAWKVLAAQLLQSYDQKLVHSRFLSGEIPLRSEKLMGMLGYGGYNGPMLRPSMLYFAKDSYKKLVLFLGLVVVVLTAMQVGLSVDNDGASSKAFQDASWGFSIFAIFCSTLIPLYFSVILFITSVSRFVKGFKVPLPEHLQPHSGAQVTARVLEESTVGSPGNRDNGNV